jgi:hypothetical protein
MSSSTERRRLLRRRSNIFQVLTEMSYKGWDGDYQPLESELEQITNRLKLLKEMEAALMKVRRLSEEY